MELIDRINSLQKLAEYLSEETPELNEKINQANRSNPWFTIDEIQFALAQAKDSLFNANHLNRWLSSYTIGAIQPKTVGLVLAGNIPMVGLHDVISVYLTGHRSKIKYSDKDNVLIPFLLEKLIELEPETESSFIMVDRLSDVDAIIATGSDTTGKYFEKYFGKYPHIIRKHRNSIAVLSGNETEKELLEFGEDVFRYFGLGCRNVSKIYAKNGFDWGALLNLWEHFSNRMEHHKYKHNFDFNYALYLMNKKEFLHNGAIILCPDDRLSSRIGTVHFSYYDQLNVLSQQLTNEMDKIQCIVGNLEIPGFRLIPFSKAQSPELDDYADNIDTIEFLLNLK